MSKDTNVKKYYDKIYNDNISAEDIKSGKVDINDFPTTSSELEDYTRFIESDKDTRDKLMQE